MVFATYLVSWLIQAVDTSGLEPFLEPGSIQGRATQITARVLQRSDLTLLLLDAREGVAAADEQLAQWLRKHVATSHVLVAANKAENAQARESECLAVNFVSVTLAILSCTTAIIRSSHLFCS